MLPVLVLLAAVQAPHRLVARPQPAAQGDVVVIETTSPPTAATLDRPAPTAASAAAGQAVLFFQDGERWVALVGIDAEAMPGRQVLHVQWPDLEADLVLEVKAKKFPTERLEVESKYVDPPAATMARIVAEKEHLDRVWARNNPDRHWQRPFRRPVEGKPSSAFGLQRVFNGQPRSPHNGVDFPVDVGVPVAATNSGEVAIAEDLYFTGKTVVIDHGLGLYTTYAHLSEIMVHPGERIVAGTIVGGVGATGRATGPHLHWGARLLAQRVDPMQLLDLQLERAAPAADAEGAAPRRIDKEETDGTGGR